jgi:hypothetical protein
MHIGQLYQRGHAGALPAELRFARVEAHPASLLSIFVSL